MLDLYAVLIFLSTLTRRNACVCVCVWVGGWCGCVCVGVCVGGRISNVPCSHTPLVITEHSAPWLLSPAVGCTDTAGTHAITGLDLARPEWALPALVVTYTTLVTCVFRGLFGTGPSIPGEISQVERAR